MHCLQNENWSIYKDWSLTDRLAGYRLEVYILI